MPDFMKGLADGIERSKGMVSKAMDGVASDLVLNPSVNAASFAGSGAGDGSGQMYSLLQELVNQVDKGREETGDIMIPVYIGQERIDEIVVRATQRANYRSGGR